MADTKISALSSNSTPSTDDALVTVDDPGGSPVTKKTTIAELGVNSNFVMPLCAFVCNSSDVTGSNTTSSQPMFASANDRLTVAASTTYKFELLIHGTNGATTCTKALDFSGGTATFTSIRYMASGQFVAVNTTGTTQSSLHVDTSAATVILATGTTAWFIKAEGIIRVNAGGTFLPQFKFSADPTGTVLIKKDSYIILYPLGSNTVAAAGAWA